MPDVNRQVLLAAYPDGFPADSDFTIEETPVPEAAAGEVLVRNIYMSVDPYMRGRMTDATNRYVPPFKIGQPMEGDAVGQVVESNDPKFSSGSFVTSRYGWREYFVCPGKDLRKVDPDVAALPRYIGVLGMPGFTAYVGLLEIGKPRKGETVFVSAAAGAVGSLVGQIARIKGCRAVGSVGSDDKIEFIVKELGFNAAFNYKDIDLHKGLSITCPEGIDVYFENVGGDLLEAVLNHANVGCRIPVCGMIAHYNDVSARPGPRNLMHLIGKRILMQGFINFDYADKQPKFMADMVKWLDAGDIVYRETIAEGIENAVPAFLGMMRGENLGKMVVRLGTDPTL